MTSRFDGGGAEAAVLDGLLVTLHEVVATPRRIADSARLPLDEVLYPSGRHRRR